MSIKLLDCTLRDGAYIVNSYFGIPAIKGIINKLQLAQIDIIECGWLKDKEHIEGTTFYHKPNDIEQYIFTKNEALSYVVMIDWDRYNLDNLPFYSNGTINSIRVVFPHEKYREGIEVGKKIQSKGYKVYFQAANTLSYSDDELKEMARILNEVQPIAISVVDTFGAMYEDELEHIVRILDEHLDRQISIGFHSHNNQQLAFSNSIHFAKIVNELGRDGIVDSSLCGMGRGAGNATTELVVNYLNNKYSKDYNLDEIMDAIDIYMEGFKTKYSWGYSTAYYIAGIYCCHVNNIAYLQDNHRTSAYDMRQIIYSLSEDERLKYDYDLLESKYMENQNKVVDDKKSLAVIKKIIDQKEEVMLIAPGKTAVLNAESVTEYIEKHNVVVIAVNALLPEYTYDFVFITNKARYEYAKNARTKQFVNTPKILLSNIKTEESRLDDELIINYNNAIKRGWKHFDNAVICCLRLLRYLSAKKVYLVGFDGFKMEYNESYADESLPTLNPEGKWEELNEEIKDMFNDVKNDLKDMDIVFLTESIFDKE